MTMNKEDISLRPAVSIILVPTYSSIKYPMARRDYIYEFLAPCKEL
jgi:hypothetical protein